MTPTRTLVTVPPRAARGDIVTVRALAQHPMENGFRHNEHGQRIARDMIRRFRCTFDGQEVFRADLLGGTWVQTSYNATIRKNYAGIGYTYDPVRDAFIPPKPTEDAVLDEATCQWVVPAPIAADSV